MKIKELLNQELTFSPKTVEIAKLFVSILKNLKYSIFFNIIAFIGLVDLYLIVQEYISAQYILHTIGYLGYGTALVFFTLYYFTFTRGISLLLLPLLLIEKIKNYKIKDNKKINNKIYNILFFTGIFVYTCITLIITVFLICTSI